jgi:mannose-6-phosphate isomerase-like protein (cupin superfamily)
LEVHQSVDALVKVSLREKFSAFEDRWSPKIVAEFDDYAVKIVKLDGEFVWHHHTDADEIFLVIAGGIRMRYLRDGIEDEVAFGPGELLRVPRGVEHLPIAEAGTEVVLLERADVVNTGNVESERTIAPVRI